VSVVVAVIPARYGSTRFPGKILAMIGDRTMIRRVHDRASECREIDRVLVATDDERILREVLAFGGTAVMTSSGHRSGTDRIAEAVRTVAPDASGVINIQGDEPFLDPAEVDLLVRSLRLDSGSIWTAVAPLRDPESLARPDVVKAARAADGRVLYFSRAAIPYLRRDRKPDHPGPGEPRSSTTGLWWRHVGIYAYPRAVLERFVALPPSSLEMAEGLEQLRALEAGISIRSIEIAPGFGGVDTGEDLERARRHLQGSDSPESTEKEA
jgi:3-deoxy-manno-octulosonate cytidylyltransferase (CMP-KDO synthetase)